MPWCEGCDRFLNPNTLRPDGTCPTCERKVAEPPPPSESSSDHRPLVETGLPASAVDVPKAPWHFKLLVAATVIYLGWRLVELVAAVVS